MAPKRAAAVVVDVAVSVSISQPEVQPEEEPPSEPLASGESRTSNSEATVTVPPPPFLASSGTRPPVEQRGPRARAAAAGSIHLQAGPGTAAATSTAAPQAIGPPRWFSVVAAPADSHLVIGVYFAPWQAIVALLPSGTVTTMAGCLQCNGVSIARLETEAQAVAHFTNHHHFAPERICL